jgi:hypothetical protein
MTDHDGSTPTGPADDAHPGYDRVGARETVVMYNALAYVLAGPLTFGPVGWGLDHLLGTSFLLPVGILFGMALSLYLVWFRYGSQ